MMSKLFHVGIYGLLFRENQLLLVQKNRGPYTGCYDLPGGRMEHGETPEQTLKREIQEETGILPITWNLYGNFSYHNTFMKGKEEVSFHHLGLIYSVPEFCEKNFSQTILEEDVAGCEWVNIPIEYPLTPFAKRIVQEIKEKQLLEASHDL